MDLSYYQTVHNIVLVVVVVVVGMLVVIVFVCFVVMESVESVFDTGLASVIAMAVVDLCSIVGMVV